MPSNRERAIALRRAGLSRSQIAAALGLKSGGGVGLKSGGGVLSKRLKDVPRPEWTLRPNAKDDLREKAIALRKLGWSYREIRGEVPVSKGSLSLWLREAELGAEQQQRLAAIQEGARARAAHTNRSRRIARQQSTIAAARAQVPALAESELFVAGVVAYWAEGSKAKPWRAGEGVAFINSDPDLVKLFLRWLVLVGVGPQRVTYRISIHESADLDAALDYWAAIFDVPKEQFFKTTLKRHNPRTQRKNTGADYHGCLVVRVRRSTELSRQIAGWWAGIAAGAADSAA